MSYLDFIFAHNRPEFIYKNSYEKSLEFFSQFDVKKRFHYYQDFFQFKECLSDIEECNEIKKVGEYLEKFDKIIVCGMGGSILNGEVFTSFSNNEKIHFIDNIDPLAFEDILKKFDCLKTGIIIISKSGNTPEVISQSLALVQYIILNYGANYPFNENLILITTRGYNFLTQFANYIQPRSIIEYKKVGGRYSIFTAVGLLIASISKLNINKIIEGAEKVLDHFLLTSIDNNIVMKAASETIALYKEKYIINAMMIYSEKYKIFGQWFRQIYAESLGKDKKYILPVIARGTTDQHGQLQIYLSGIKNIYFTFVSYDSRNLGIRNNIPFKSSENEYLNNMTMGDLYYYEKEATIQSLRDKKLPVRELILKQLNEMELGSVLMHYMIETILVGFQMEVNPFDELAIESNKLLAKKYLEEAKNLIES